MDANDQYHADTTRISKSGCDKINRSPAHYWANYLDPDREPREETKAFFTGSLLHTDILEPGEIEKKYIVLPADAPGRDCLRHRNAKAPSPETLKNIAWWDRWLEQYGDKIIIDAKLWTRAQRIRDRVMNHSAARWLLERPAITEVAHTWEDLYTGAPCKCKPDRRLHEDFLLVDLKSTEDASVDGFSKSVLNYRYDVQGAFYLDGFNSGPAPILHDDFIFIAVEKEPPFAVGVYRLPDEAVEIGREKYMRNLNTYMECKRTGVWPAYSDEVIDLRMPKYYFKQL